jgi:hypothetical protein
MLILQTTLIFNSIFAIASFGGPMFEIIYGKDSSFTFAQTLNIISIVDPAAQAVAIFIVPMVSRRLLLIGGYLLVTCFNILVGITDRKNADIGVLICTLGLVAVSSMTQEPVSNLYQTEVSNNATQGAVSLINNIFVLIYSFMLPPLVRDWIGPNMMFIINGVMSALSALFIMFFIKETSKLTDKEKKLLYSPKVYRNELD